MTLRTVVVAFLFLLAGQGQAQRLVMHVGPPAIGSGGSNPLSVPPTNPLDYEVVYVTPTDREWAVSLSPGIFYGRRFWIGATKGPYVSLGGGMLLNYQGAGPAAYSAFGLDSCGHRVCFNIEIKQALGLTFRGGLGSAYAVRIGAAVKL